MTLEKIINLKIQEVEKSSSQKSKPKRISIVIPTFNHKEEPIETISQIIKIATDLDEILIIDQNEDNYNEKWTEFLDSILKYDTVRLIKSNIPSIPLARNIGGLKSHSEIILYIDDDMDIGENIIENHLAYYKDKKVGGVAGSIDGKNKKSEKNRRYVNAAKGGHMSFKKNVFLAIKGFDILFDGNFSGEETEFCERVRNHGFKIANGIDCIAFHRAPIFGGAGNQGKLGLDWYKKTYSNHFYWIKKRKGIKKYYRLPRHLYYLARYFRPNSKSLFSIGFLKALLIATRNARKKTSNQTKNQEVWNKLSS
ncbi:glycosyltransferase family 2 protein [Marinobacter sp. BSs20148]|uniref:glycosyltransferase family 2 protein n=1 Tax=Marinobacter sp. BSs20148 TaxID=490759 RepID=UPI0002776BA0|nr:glycosyltransferase [Marinobacter sp. BSs20148]AFP31115.1 hypothetical protein MRBBS_2178 [Marinobacter sp. BSs20148]